MEHGQIAKKALSFLKTAFEHLGGTFVMSNYGDPEGLAKVGSGRVVIGARAHAAYGDHQDVSLFVVDGPEGSDEILGTANVNDHGEFLAFVVAMSRQIMKILGQDVMLAEKQANAVREVLIKNGIFGRHTYVSDAGKPGMFEVSVTNNKPLTDKGPILTSVTITVHKSSTKVLIGRGRIPVEMNASEAADRAVMDAVEQATASPSRESGLAAAIRMLLTPWKLATKPRVRVPAGSGPYKAEQT